MHTDSGASERHHGSHSLERHLRHQIEEACKIRMRLRQRSLHHHEFSGTRHENRNIVLKVMVFILAVQLHDTGPDQMINDFLCLFLRHVILLRKLLRRIVDAGLAEAQHKLRLFLCQHLIQRPVLRIIRLHGMRQLHRIAIGDHLAKPLDQFLFLLVRRSIAMDLFIITFIGHAVFLFFHDSILLLPSEALLMNTDPSFCLFCTKIKKSQRKSRHYYDNSLSDSAKVKVSQVFNKYDVSSHTTHNTGKTQS